MYKDFVMMKYYDTSKKEERAAALASDNYALQLKLDGAGYILGMDADGIPHLNNGKISKPTGKLIDKIDNVPHLAQWARDNMPPESQFAVEMYSHYDWKCAGAPVYNERESSKYASSILGSTLPAKAIARQKQTELMKVHIFDCLFWNGEEIYKKDFADRWAVVTDFWRDFSDSHTGYDNNGEYYNDVPEWISPTETVFEDKADAIAQWLSEGKEGGVLKMLRSVGKVDASYHIREIGSTPARPRHTTYKIKEVDTADVVITQIYMPTSEYTGKDPENHPYKDEDGNPINRLFALGIANSFGIGVYKDGELIQIGTCASGMNDELRGAMAEYPDNYIGMVAEIVYMSKDNVAGTFRHARLKHLREDKDAQECTYEVTFN